MRPGTQINKLPPNVPNISAGQPTSLHRQLCCQLLNARSLKNKMADLHQLLYSAAQPTCFFVTESWLDSNITNNMLDPNQYYTILRSDRTDRLGGGVCCFIPAHIKVNSINVNVNNNNLLKSTNCETALFDLHAGQCKIRVMTIYIGPRNPNVDQT